MRVLFTVLIVVACAGCSTPPLDHGSVIKTNADGSRIENRSDYAEYTKTKLELANKPLFRLECPDSGCLFKSLEVANPNAANDIALPAPPPKVESAAVGVAREVKEMFGLLVPIGMAATIGHSVASIFTQASNANVAIAGKIQAPQANVSTMTSTSTVNSNSGNTSSTANTNSGNTTSTTSTSNSNTGTGGSVGNKTP